MEQMTGEEMARRLAHQLNRLLKMRQAALMLLARDQLGQDFFASGCPAPVPNFRTPDREG